VHPEQLDYPGIPVLVFILYKGGYKDALAPTIELIAFLRYRAA
jgi:hypothetical protein